MNRRRVHFIDFETWPTAPGLKAPPIVCMSWKSDGDAASSLALWHDAKPILIGMLRQAARGEAVVVSHFIGFDASCAIADNDLELGRLIWAALAADGVECTMEREKLLDIEKGEFRKSKGKSPYSLDSIAQRRLGMPPMDKGADSWRMRYKELAGTPIELWPERARVYALNDSDVGKAVYDDQEREMYARRRHPPTRYIDARMSVALYLTGAWGTRVDKQRATALLNDLRAKMAQLRQRLIAAGLMRYKESTLPLFSSIVVPTTKDEAAIRAAVESTWPRALGDVPRTDATSRHPRGQIKTDKDTIDMCTHPALQALVTHNKLEKTATTYVEAMVEAAGDTIHAGYNALVSSGRTSSYGFNMQNLPRKAGIRECMVARPGRVIAASDFSSQEVRTLAEQQEAILGRSRLAAMFRRDPKYDPHTDFAGFTGGKRQHAKIAVFGIPGGMGVKGLIRYAKGYDVHWSPEFAAQIKKQYLTWIPEMDDYFAWVRNVVGNDRGDLVMPQSGMMMGGVKYTEACNRLFQTLAAHASKDAHFQVVRRCFDDTLGSPLIGSRPWAFIHDEPIVECPEEATDEVCPEMERVMVEAMQPWVPHVPCLASATAQRRWSKDGEHTYDTRGRIVPWDDTTHAAA